MSAHQFSENHKSVQADEEEKLNLDMLSNNSHSINNKGVGMSRNFSRGTTVLSRQLSTTSVGKTTKKLKDSDTLFNLSKTRNDMGMQTDGESDHNRTVFKPKKAKIESDDCLSLEKRIDPDQYKEDWATSVIYKKAMAQEAIKRGIRVDSDYEVDVDDEKVNMTITGYETQT